MGVKFIKERSDMGEGGAVGGWHDLVAQTRSWMSTHLDKLDERKIVAVAPNSSLETVKADAAAGIATVAAFLEVVPRALRPQQLGEESNSVPARYARNSIGFITEWSGLHHVVDLHLAYALNENKPDLNLHRDYGLNFVNLRFDEQYFEVDTSTETVRLSFEAAQTLRGFDGGHPTNVTRGATALFGCPFPHIRQLTAMMIDQAEQQNLFVRTYEEARGSYELSA
jgi:hypothetical protein